jgi:hypothetical protein
MNDKFNVSLTKRVKLPEDVALLLMDEAKRRRRTVPKQIEAILCAYYETDIELQDILNAEVIQ